MRKSFKIVVVGLALLAMVALVSSGTPGVSLAKSAGTASGKLSFRLEALSRSSELRASSSDVQARALSLPASGPGSLLRDNLGRLLVDIRMDDLSALNLQALRTAGAAITHVSDRYKVVTALVNATDLTNIANLPSVKSVQEELAPQRGSTLPSQLQGTSNAPAACPAGAAVSAGDTQLRANLARSTFGIDGSGVKVGILSDSYDMNGSAVTTAAQDVASGDLPGGGNPCSYSTAISVLDEGPTSGEDEGRAMLQIVHDLAPGAELAFATADSGESAFADNIRNLRTWGAEIIADDVSYFDEPFFQEGEVSVAISDVVSSGAMYFTSAANSNQIVGGQNVASYEAPSYRPTTCPVALPGLTCHDFDPGSGTNNGSAITLANNGAVQIIFQWAEPWYGIADDFGIYLLNSSNTVVASSDDNNFTTEKPFEYIFHQNTTGSTQTYRIVINRHTGSGTPRLKYIFTQSTSGLQSVQYNTSSGGDIVGPTIYGHSASLYSASVAAAPYNDNNNPETFSSRGPAAHYFGPIVGTTAAAAITPQTIQQPDFTATDGGCTTFFASVSNGCYRFYGTSAAAPHAAAVAALMTQEAHLVSLTLSQSQTKSILHSTARVMSGGSLNSTGGGLIDALAATQWVQNASTSPTITSLNPTSATPGGSAFTLAVTGTNFISTSVVQWNGLSRTTTHLSSTRLTASILAADIQTAGTAQITVYNPDGSGTSNAMNFSVGNSSWTVYLPIVSKDWPLPPGPTPGFWASTTGDEFYVSTDRASVVKFTIYVDIPCETLMIYRTVPSAITNNQFSFSGTYYASGTFDSVSSAHGTDGLNNFYTSECGGGYLTAGPWSWTATWQNSSQPAVVTNLAEPATVQFVPFSDNYHQATQVK